MEYRDSLAFSRRDAVRDELVKKLVDCQRSGLEEVGRHAGQCPQGTLSSTVSGLQQAAAPQLPGCLTMYRNTRWWADCGSWAVSSECGRTVGPRFPEVPTRMRGGFDQQYSQQRRGYCGSLLPCLGRGSDGRRCQDHGHDAVSRLVRLHADGDFGGHRWLRETRLTVGLRGGGEQGQSVERDLRG